MITLVFYMMNFVKLMKFVLNMMDLQVKMLKCVLKMMDLQDMSGNPVTDLGTIRKIYLFGRGQVCIVE